MTRLATESAPVNGFAVKPAAVVFDSDASRRRSISEIVSQCGGVSIDIASNSAEAIIEKCNSTDAVALLLDLDSGLSEEEVLGLVHCVGNHKVRSICYASKLGSWAVGKRCRLLLAGASRTLDSGAAQFQLQIRDVVRQAIRSHYEQADHVDQQGQLASKLGMIGQSDALLSLVSWVAKISPLSDLQVLITGETGTGKELVAQSLHQLDPRRATGPFVAWNCAAVSPALAESELFGHQRGAFTGSELDREGAFRSAAGGVLFLDEIGELPLALQAKLLRVLQEKRVRSVGDDRETEVDVRVIAATHRDLKNMVRKGDFRADLLHRLSVLTVQVPPLRERREDIPPLVQHFADKYQHLNPQRTVVVADDYHKALAQLDLSGNVRQLENIVRWSLVNKEDDIPFGLSDLPAESWAELASREQSEGESLPSQRQSERTLPAELTQVMKSHDWRLSPALHYCESIFLQSALKHARGNQSRAAQLMGITPRSVHNKMRKYGLRR
jgi:transcriptional regulator with GAF, ATPase, and Fis domain